MDFQAQAKLSSQASEGENWIELVIDNAQLIDIGFGFVGLLIASVIAGVGIWQYVDTRKRQLQWQRTEFIFAQAQYLDTDEHITLAVSVLAGTDPEVAIENCFVTGQLSKQIKPDYSLGFEKLFNLLDRLAYAHFQSQSLTLIDLANFRWYFDVIAKHPETSLYCEKNGFGDTIRMAAELDSL